MTRCATLVVALALACNALAAEASNEITVENVLRLMNDSRSESGLPPLHADQSLAKAAHDRMRDMADGGWWSHESPDGVPPFVWLTARGYEYSAAGENLAAGFETVRLLVASWMESPGHRANILNANYEDCGIAILDGATTGPADGKSIVVLFGRRVR
jgi:uncharacterized protein YkwD